MVTLINPIIISIKSVTQGQKNELNQMLTELPEQPHKHMGRWI